MKLDEEAATAPAEQEWHWMKPIEEGFIIVLRHPDGREVALEQFGIFWCGCEKCAQRMAQACAAATMQTGFTAAAVRLDRGGDVVTSEIDLGSRH